MQNLLKQVFRSVGECKTKTIYNTNGMMEFSADDVDGIWYMVYGDTGNGICRKPNHHKYSTAQAAVQLPPSSKTRSLVWGMLHCICACILLVRKDLLSNSL